MSLSIASARLIVGAALLLPLAMAAASCTSEPPGQASSLNQLYLQGQNTDFGAKQGADTASQPAPEDVRPRVSATVPMVAGQRDVVGGGGYQDQLGKEMYHTGHDLTEMLGGG